MPIESNITVRPVSQSEFGAVGTLWNGSVADKSATGGVVRRPLMPFNSCGRANGRDQVMPPSVFSTGPAFVSTNICFALRPRIGLYWALLTSNPPKPVFLAIQ
jgi:hypothetical protein